MMPWEQVERWKGRRFATVPVTAIGACLVLVLAACRTPPSLAPTQTASQQASPSPPPTQAATRVVATAPAIRLGTSWGGVDPWSPDGRLFVLAMPAASGQSPLPSAQRLLKKGLYDAQGRGQGTVPGWCGWMTAHSYLRCLSEMDAGFDLVWQWVVQLESGEETAVGTTAWLEFPDGQGNTVECDDTFRCRTDGWIGWRIRALALSRGGERVAVSAYPSGRAEIVETRTGTVLRSLSDPVSEKARAQFSPSGEAVAIRDGGRHLLVNIASGSSVVPDVPGEASAGWTADGRYLVVDSVRGVVRAFDAEGNEVPAGLPYAPALAFSRDGAVVGVEASAGSNWLTFIMADRRGVADLPGPPVGDPWLSPDGQSVLVVAQDGANQSGVLVTLKADSRSKPKVLP